MLLLRSQLWKVDWMHLRACSKPMLLFLVINAELSFTPSSLSGTLKSRVSLMLVKLSHSLDIRVMILYKSTHNTHTEQ
jgi:hypothetical protein